jgi:hypothetical protein
MPVPEIGKMDVLPCGCTVECVLIAGERIVQMVPCRPDCEFLAYATNRAKQDGKSIKYEGAP